MNPSLKTCVDCGASICHKATRCRPCGAKEVGRKLTGTQRAKMVRPIRPMPDDFMRIAPGMSAVQLKQHYRCRTDAITRWRKEANLAGLQPGRKIVAVECIAIPLPVDFTAVAPTLRMVALCQHYDRSPRVVRRWIVESGVKPIERHKAPVRLVPTRPMGMQASLHHQRRDYSRAGQAADYLRKFGPVVRCDAAGRFKADGDHWRRGSGKPLTADEIIGRAESQGWQADAWRQVAA